jgi:signal peptidase I
MSFLRGFVRDLAFFVFLFLFIYYFVMNVSVVRGKSMEPNFHDGDRLIVDKLTYKLTDITEEDRFDVVVLKNPLDPSEDYIKRLVALPGEWVEIKDGILYIDGTKYEESGIYLDSTREYGPVRVREGHYFVLGDNRAHSNDSLNFGGVPKDYIKGKIRVRFWPVDDLRFFP